MGCSSQASLTVRSMRDPDEFGTPCAWEDPAGFAGRPIPGAESENSDVLLLTNRRPAGASSTWSAFAWPNGPLNSSRQEEASRHERIGSAPSVGDVAATRIETPRALVLSGWATSAFNPLPASMVLEPTDYRLSRSPCHCPSGADHRSTGRIVPAATRYCDEKAGQMTVERSLEICWFVPPALIGRASSARPPVGPYPASIYLAVPPTAGRPASFRSDHTAWVGQIVSNVPGVHRCRPEVRPTRSGRPVTRPARANPPPVSQF